MSKKPVSSNSNKASAQPRFHQSARELQPFGTVTSVQPLQLEEPIRLEMTEQLNQLLADTMTLRDLYKKSHWQVSGATFYQLHLLFDKHYEEQNNIVDTIAERIQLLGGVSIAMAADVAEATRIPRPPRAAKKFPCNCRACSTRTRSSSRNAAKSLSSPPNWETQAPTIWPSAMYFAPTNCKSGSSANTSSMRRWWKLSR